MPSQDEAYRRSLERALAGALDHLHSLANAPVDATVSRAELRRRLVQPLPEDGCPAEQVIAELLRDVEGGIIGSAGGRFFAWVVGGVLPSALAADWLTSTWDQNSALHASGPAAALVEEAAGAWLKDLLQLPESASFALVTGCQMAHVTCLAAARHALLQKQGWNVEEQGLWAAPRIRLLTSLERHGSLERAVRLLGFGRAHLRTLPVDEQGCLEPETLRAALQESEAPAIVVLQAGDVNTGIFDDFSQLIPLARDAGAWVHVDGAFGLWAAASPQLRHLTNDVGQADSWATDGHKWLNVPYDCGYAFVKDPAPHRAAVSHRESYLVHDAEGRDQMDWTLEWSRRGRGFATYAALRQLGRQGVAGLVEQCCRQAARLVEGIGCLPGAVVLRTPLINQGLVRFLDPQPQALEADHDRYTDAVIAAVRASGEAFFGGTSWRGQRAMRISVCNWQTTDEDVERTIKAFARALRDVAPGGF